MPNIIDAWIEEDLRKSMAQGIPIVEDPQVHRLFVVDLDDFQRGLQNIVDDILREEYALGPDPNTLTPEED
jgi:hypothetical protein